MLIDLRPFIHYFIAAAFCLGLVAPSAAQDKAEELIAQQRYGDAALAYERFIKKNPEHALAHERLGLAYKQLRQFEEAERMFERAELLDGLSESALVHYGQVLLKNGKPDEARKQFEKYLKKDPESLVVRMMVQSLAEVQGWSYLSEAFEVKRVTGINSKFSDFAPVMYGEKVVFATERHEDLVNETSSAYNNLPFLAVYYAETKDEYGLQTRTPKPFLTKLYGDYHVGPVSIDTVNRYIYYSEVKPENNKDVNPKSKTYVAEIINGKRLGEPMLLSFNGDFSVAHPSVTPDGKTLYFASNRPGGLGGMDLFFVTKTETGWSEPVAMPESVNTALNDVFPFALNENVLYFASDGHPGYGGLDLFKTEFVDGKWSQPINLKKPINSEHDDFGIVFQNETKGYFSSDRIGGEGLDDIYQFVQMAEPDDQNRVAVNGVFEYGKLPPNGITMRLLDENDNLLEEVKTDGDGNFAFTNLPENKNYKLEVVDAPPEMLAEAQVYIFNKAGEKVLILDRISESQFVFKTLPKEQLAGLAVLEETDRRLGTYEIFGHLFSALDKEKAGNITLEVFDDKGTIVRTVKTDSNGLFLLTEMQKDQFYTIKPKTDEQLTADVYTEDKRGIQRMESKENEFFLLSQLIAQKKLEMENQVPVKGYLQVDGKPVGNAKMIMLDSTKQHMLAARTDRSGLFNFGSAHSGERHRIVLPDSLMKKGKKVEMILVDKDGNALDKVVADASGRMNLRAPDRVRYGLPPAAQALAARPQKISGQVFRKLPGDYRNGLEINALDDQGKIIETAVADAEGNFEFTKLNPGANYNFSVTKQDLTGLNVMLYDEQRRLIQELRLDELATYLYAKLGREDARIATVEEEKDDSEFDTELVAGQIYSKLPGDYKPGIVIYALDDQGNAIDSAVTDSRGNFEFKSLNRDENFKLSVDDNEDVGMRVAFYNFEGHFSDAVALDSANAFTYSKVVLEAAAELKGDDLADKPPVPVYGQVYKKLPGDYEPGITVFAVDERGNVLDSATTDEKGNFKFYKLSRENDFKVQVHDTDDSELNLAFYDVRGDYNTTVALDRDSTYAYSEIILMDPLINPMKQKAPDESILGQIYKETPGDYARGTRVYALDEKGKIIDVATLDVQGKFNFSKLTKDASYMIMLEESSDLSSVSFEIITPEGEVVEKVEQEDGAWAFSKLQHERYRMALVEEEDGEMDARKFDTAPDKATEQPLAQVPTAPKPEPKPVEPIIGKPKSTPVASAPVVKPERTSLKSANATIYYDFREYTLTPDDSALLDGIANSLLADDSAFIRIHSHIDGTELSGQTTFSTRRSVSVAKYLHQRGVAVERMYVVNYEETKDAHPCPEGTPCSQSERALNQRSELFVVTRKEIPTEPNYIFLYEFNQWLIPKNGYVPLAGLIRVLKESPSYTVQLDGYADMTGAFRANQRISQLRADNLKNYLVSKGIDGERIEVVWHGEMIPLGGCILAYPCPPADRKQNRRVEVRIIK